MMIDRETATREIDGWLDYIGIKESSREGFKDQITRLVDAVCDGHLSIDDKHFITHRLIRPFNNEKPLHELVYKPDLTIGEVRLKSTLITEDFHAYSIAYVAALSKQTTDIIRKLNIKDFAIAKAVADFFS